VLVLAPFIGSFLVCLADRTFAGRSIVIGRSSCDVCMAVLHPVDLVPIWSFLNLRGSCRYCDTRIPTHLFSAECLALAIALMAAAAVPPDWLLPSCILGWLLTGLFVADCRYFILPDTLNLSLFASGAVVTYLLMPEMMVDHMVAAIIGATAFLILRAVYSLARGREGLGWGDIKLIMGLGAWFGLESLPALVLLACITGFGIVLVQHVRGSVIDRHLAIPFGACLCFAGWFTWITGPTFDAFASPGFLVERGLDQIDLQDLWDKAFLLLGVRQQ
jgi:leader peptidase (prepilin peptidase)/N-methyltransferase